MKAPEPSTQEKFKKKVEQLNEQIEKMYSKNDQQLAKENQKTLDKLETEYKDIKDDLKDYYKLYELQSLIYYFNKDNYKALEFINYAEKEHGGSYKRSREIKESLEGKSKKLEKKPSLIKSVGVFFIAWLGGPLIEGLITIALFGSPIYTSGIITFIFAIVIASKYKNGDYNGRIGRMYLTIAIAELIFIALGALSSFFYNSVM